MANKTLDYSLSKSEEKVLKELTLKVFTRINKKYPELKAKTTMCVVDTIMCGVIRLESASLYSSRQWGK